MPVLDVGDRLNTLTGRLDLAADLIGAMVHPKDKTERRRRQVALAETALAMSDSDDDPEIYSLVDNWFWAADGFRTASEAYPYSRQQKDLLRLSPKIITVGMALEIVWRMDAHHRATLQGGTSLNKAFAIIRNPISRSRVSERTLRSTWARYKPVAHLCAGFALVLREASLQRSDELVKVAFDEELSLTLSLMAAYQRFATSFTPHGQDQPLLNSREIWLLRGAEAHETFVPPPLPREVLAIAEAYRAPQNAAYG